MPKPRRSGFYYWATWLTIYTFVLCACAVFYFFTPGHPIEERTITSDNHVHFVPMRMNRLDIENFVNGFRNSTKSHERIGYMIYGSEAVYIFTRSGRVYAMRGNEGGVPASLVEQWQWTGDPHQFPYFDYDYSIPGEA